jgi:hypothetical protein
VKPAGVVEWRPMKPGAYRLTAEIGGLDGGRRPENIYEFEVVSQ